MAAPPPAQASIIDRKALAAEAFQRGQLALRAEQPAQAVAELTRALELAPHDVDYGALLGWAKFCATPDKLGIADETRRALEEAIARSPNPEIARLYLGRVERMILEHRALLRACQGGSTPGGAR